MHIRSSSIDGIVSYFLKKERGFLLEDTEIKWTAVMNSGISENSVKIEKC